MPGTASNASGGGGSGYYAGGDPGALAKYNRGAFLRETSELGLTDEQAATLADRYFPMPPSVTVHGGQGSAGAPRETDGASAQRALAAKLTARLEAEMEGADGGYADGLYRALVLLEQALPADSSGSELAADSAGSGLAANPAGSDPLARIAEALERIAATVAVPVADAAGWAAPYVRVTNA